MEDKRKYYDERCSHHSYCSGNSKGYGCCEPGTMNETEKYIYLFYIFIFIFYIYIYYKYIYTYTHICYIHTVAEMLAPQNTLCGSNDIC